MKSINVSYILCLGSPDWTSDFVLTSFAVYPEVTRTNTRSTDRNYYTVNDSILYIKYQAIRNNKLEKSSAMYLLSGSSVDFRIHEGGTSTVAPARSPTLLWACLRRPHVTKASQPQ